MAAEHVCCHLAEVGVAWQFATEDATVLAARFGESAPRSLIYYKLRPAVVAARRGWSE